MQHDCSGSILRRTIYLLFFFVLTAGLQAQVTEPITGTVIDTDGNPLIGVTVVEKGTSTGTVTDLDGNFSLSVAGSTSILRFTYIGFSPSEILIGSQTDISVTLDTDSATLDEIVVIGYGTQKRADVTGSVSQIDGAELNIGPLPNLSANLAGKLTGVVAVQTSGQPGFDDANFQIRGISTLGNNSPLILVDGIERSLSRINPNTIASVTVLKDAASTAVYGSRAANGVLLITTKRAAEGKPRFTAGASFGLQAPAGRPELMDANEYVLAFRQALTNEGSTPDELPFPELVEDAEAGRLPSYDWWNETLTNSAPQQQYDATVEGGSDNLRYFFAAGYLNQEGFLENAKYERFEVRSNVDADLAEGLTLSIDLVARKEDRLRSADSDGEIFSNVLRANPLNPVFLDGLPGAENLPARSLGFDGFSGNSFGDANRNGSQDDDITTFQSNFTMNYKLPFAKGLVARALYSYDNSDSKRRTFFTPYTSYQRNEADGTYIPLQSDNIRSLDEDRRNNVQRTIQLSMRYNKKWGDHTFGALTLFEQIAEDFSRLSAFRDGFLSDRIQQFFAGNVVNDENFGTANQTARRGYVGRIDYGYKNRYLLQFNVRADQSYIFAEDRRTGYFPAFSLGWRISEEPWMQSVDWLSSLKVRGSYGVTGNDRVGSFRYLAGFRFSGGYVENNTFQQGIRPTGLANPNITWERATTTDVGVEASLLDGRFTFELDYYEKRTEDILATRNESVPLTFGAQLPLENLGIVDSWGWELAVGHRNNIGKLGYGIAANLTLVDNEIVFIDEPIGVNPAISRTNNQIGVRTGYLSDGLYQTQAEIDEGPDQFGTLQPGDIRYKDVNGRDADGNLTGQPDGRVNADDRVIIAPSGTPNLIYGMNFDFDYGGFTLALNFQGASQYSRTVAPRGFLLGVGNNFDVLNDSWTVDNPDARYPRILPDGNNNNNQTSDFFVENINFLRLRNAQLSYNLGSILGLLDKTGFDVVNVTLSGSNLLTFSNVSIGDPEGTNGNALFYPIAKVISVGLNVGF